ncbi:MAG: ribonuclease HII [Rhizobiales bacterium]|nr:ribonuclease HII [Hyphomicrobiales bacterium]
MSRCATSSGPDFHFEREAGAPDMLVCGIDEAGRGPLAGPVVAAAVILNHDDVPPGLNDSKKLSEKKRDALYTMIMARAAVGIGLASVEEIDTLNILQASLLAMTRACAKLPSAPALALIDGNRLPRLDIRAQALVGGDARSLSIAAASIIAKVARDAMMQEMERLHPGYGFAKHKGYGTAAHLDAISRLGPCPHHRKSFAPIRNILSPGIP